MISKINIKNGQIQNNEKQIFEDESEISDEGSEINVEDNKVAEQAAREETKEKLKVCLKNIIDILTTCISK